jgi:hypothetical protein
MINVGIAGSLSAVNRHIYALNTIQNVQLSGTLDPLENKRNEKIIERSDALIITDQGDHFFDLAVRALRSAKHVYLYPSVVQSMNNVSQLIKLASEANVILKCGRTSQSGLNNLLKKLPDLKDMSMIDLQHEIRMEENNRPMQEMVLGDMELVADLIRARNTYIRAKGLNIVSVRPEIINARLEFDNGSVVNYYCNTLGTQNLHHFTLACKDNILKYNILTKELTGWTLKRTGNQNENPIFIGNFQVEQADYLADDLRRFFNLIHSGPAFLSIYDNGFESFLLADRILEKVSKTLVQFA